MIPNKSGSVGIKRPKLLVYSSIFTEIGVKKFVPLITERTERHDLSKMDRLNRILKEAAEQSGRAMIPELLPPVRFDEIIVKNVAGEKIVFDTTRLF